MICTQMINKFLKIIQQIFLCTMCRWYCLIRPVLPETLQKWLAPLHSLLCSPCEALPSPTQDTPPLWQSAITGSVALFADHDLTRIEHMVTHLKKLMSVYPVKSVRFSNLTGLVRTLRGDFYSDQEAATTEESMINISKNFLQDYGTALHGVENKKDVYYQEGSPRIIGSCVRLCQTDRSGFPVYGATMTFGFHQGYLGIIMNSWYPLSPQAEYSQQFTLPLENAKNKAIEHVKIYLRKQKEEAEKKEENAENPRQYLSVPENLGALPERGDTLDDDHVGKVIFPCHPLLATPEIDTLNARNVEFDASQIWSHGNIEREDSPSSMPFREDRYRPAWAILVINEDGPECWHVMVNANPSPGECIILSFRELNAPLSSYGYVYENNAQASQNPPTLSKKELPGFSDTPCFLMTYPRGWGDDWKYENPSNNDNEGEQLKKRSVANVYYHLYKAMKRFEKIASDAWQQEIAQEIVMPGAKRAFNVSIGQKPTQYNHHPDDPQKRNIQFLWYGPPPQNAFPEHSYDCEVIYHEYTHAVVGMLQPDIYKNFQYTWFDNALNEALAFYFGCTLSEAIGWSGASAFAPFRWGDYAYKAKQDCRYDLCRETGQQANLDYFQTYKRFPDYFSGGEWRLYHDSRTDYGNFYVCGMAWARVLWDIRRILGEEFENHFHEGYKLADAIILRSLPLLSGVQSEFETTAEAILYCDSSLCHSSYEKALRAIFRSRGILIDTPIHDLLPIHCHGLAYLLAAINPPDPATPKSGCMVSENSGETWESLSDWGLIPTSTLSASVPKEGEDADINEIPATKVIALAAVEWEHKVVFWTANEAWSKNPGGGYSMKTGVFQYEVIWENNGEKKYFCGQVGNFNCNVEGNLSILSLAAVKNLSQNGPEYLVFAGTERGLYQFDGNSWTLVAQTELNRRIFDVAAEESNPPFLSIATHDGTYAGHLGNLVSNTNLGTILTTTASKDTNQKLHLWAGTLSGQIWKYSVSASNPQWTRHSNISRPVYTLLVKEDGTMYAGTDAGIYTYQEDSWKPWNTRINLEGQTLSEGETLDASTVIALVCEGDTLFAGTTDRGLWMNNGNQGWLRLPLLDQARWVDHQIPLKTATETLELTGHLEKKRDVGTHVLYVQENYCGRLSFVVPDRYKAKVILALYTAAPYIDGIHYKVGGLTRINEPLADLTVNSGLYVLTVTAKSGATDYTVKVVLHEG